MVIREIHIIGENTRERLLSAQTCVALRHLGLNLAGFSLADASFRFERKEPTFAQLLLTLEGIGVAWLDGEWVTLGPGQAYLTPPGLPHAYKSVAGSTWSICWVQASVEWYRRVVGSARHVEIIMIDATPLSTALEWLEREDIDPGDQTTVAQWAGLVDSYLSRALQPQIGDKRLSRLFLDVGADPAFPWNLQLLSDRAGLGAEQLRRLCLKQYHRSPMRQVTQVRMRHASSLLSADSYTIARVAEEVGYDNPFAFSTAFKRIMGSSPGSFRGRGGRGRI